MEALKYNKTIPVELVEEGDVVCVSGNSFISKAIKSGMPKMFTKSEWSHCAVVVMDDFGNLEFIEANPEGVVRTPLDRYCSTNKDVDAVVLLRLKKPLTDAEYRNFYEWLEPQVGTKYDKAGLIGFALHIIFKIGNLFHHKKQWFCSELVAEAFKRAGRPISYLPSELVSPRTVFESVELERIL